MEIWDAYNENFEKIEGITLVRGEPIPDGMFHLVCDVIVRHKDGTYLLMQRAHNKSHGGMWETTAGGSALQGEAPLECAERELREETGIAAHNLREIGRMVNRCAYPSLHIMYLCVTDRNKNNITLQNGETIDYKWLSRDELLKMEENDIVSKRIWKFVPELANK